ncbi:MAG: hypothetical protein HW410_159 [Nitrosarchaeum sp.]|nr:hypothetical protein [Nitrosarchaeum sp.]
MSYKTIITITAIAVITLATFAELGIDNILAESKDQPKKFVFVENTTTTALFEFRDGSELVPIQQFVQTAGFGAKSLVSVDDPKADSGASGRANPSFTMEKIVGGTPYLYAAADQTQQYYTSSGFEYPYKFFDVTVFLAQGGDVLRSFEYRDCQVTNYLVNTRSDNEEGYTGKGFVLVDQFSFECKGYTPINPQMVKMNHVEKAKMISSNDLKNTDQWAPEFRK